MCAVFTFTLKRATELNITGTSKGSDFGSNVKERGLLGFVKISWRGTT